MARTVTAPPDSRCAFESCVRGGLNQPRGVRPIHIRTRAIVARCRNEARAALPNRRKQQPVVWTCPGLRDTWC